MRIETIIKRIKGFLEEMSQQGIYDTSLKNFHYSFKKIRNSTLEIKRLTECLKFRLDRFIKDSVVDKSDIMTESITFLSLISSELEIIYYRYDNDRTRKLYYAVQHLIYSIDKYSLTL